MTVDLAAALANPLIDAFEQKIVQAPRTQQRLIGPSEIGIPCDRCLGKKLVMKGEHKEAAWYPAQGTAIHSWAEEAVNEHFPRGITEKRVHVGIVANRLISGTCDLYDTDTNTVLDYKFTGQTTINGAKKAPKVQYHRQVHLYGRGFELLGYPVQYVSILYLPRTEPTLRKSFFWYEPYNRQVALDALNRAEIIANYVMQYGDAAIITLPRAQGCFTCPKYPQLPGEDSPYENMSFMS